jgi:lysyl-tRNA synthetase class 2
MPSQVIRALAYDADRNELTVGFTSGRIYVYSLIPPAVFAALEATASKGAFFNQHIRDRYPFRKAKSDTAAPSSLLDQLHASQS